MNNTVKNVLYKLDGRIRSEISTRIELWSIAHFLSYSDYGGLDKKAEEMAKYHLEEADGVFFVYSNKNNSILEVADGIFMASPNKNNLSKNINN